MTETQGSGPLDGMPTWMYRKRGRGAAKDAADWLAQWLSLYGDEGTQDSYRRSLVQFFRWMRLYRSERDANGHLDPTGIEILEADSDDISDYMVYLASNHYPRHLGPCWDTADQKQRPMECRPGVLPYHPSAIETKMAAVSSFYAYLAGRPDCEQVKFNPVPLKRGRSATGNAAREQVKEILLPSEIETVYETAMRAAQGEIQGMLPTYRHAAVFAMFVGAGLRREELENCRVENLAWRGTSRTLRFQRKNKAWVTIDLPHGVNKVLTLYTRDRTSGPLIISDGRKRRNQDTGELEFGKLSSVSLWAIVKDLCAAAQIDKDVYPHLLRTTSITLALTLLAAKESKVADYYGHKSFETTRLHYNVAGILEPGEHHHRFELDWEKQGLVLAA